jgi:hypothetical protein
MAKCPFGKCLYKNRNFFSIEDGDCVHPLKWKDDDGHEQLWSCMHVPDRKRKRAPPRCTRYVNITGHDEQGNVVVEYRGKNRTRRSTPASRTRLKEERSKVKIHGSFARGRKITTSLGKQAEIPEKVDEKTDETVETG